MKVYIDFEDGKNQQLVAEYNSAQEKLIRDQVGIDNFSQDVMRRLEWVLNEKISGCLKRLTDSWKDKIKERYESIPSNDLAVAQLIFSQEDYKSFYDLNHEV